MQAPDSLSRRLIAGGAWALGGKVVTAVCELFTVGLLSRLLTKGEYGSYAAAFTLITGCAMLAQFGLHMAVVRFVAEALGTGRPGRARAIVVRATQLLVIGCALVGGALALGAGRWFVVRVWESSLLAASITTVAAWAVLQAMQVFVSETFRGFKDIRLATIFGGTITRILILVALLVAASVADGLRLSDALLIIVGATTVSLLVGGTLLLVRIRSLPVGGRVGAGEVLSVSAPMWVTGLTTFVLAQFDQWIVPAFFGEAQFAHYGAAARLVSVVSMSLTLVNLVVPPFIADLYARGEHERLQRVLRTTATLAGLPALFVLGTFILAGDRVLATIFRPDYAEGATILALLSGARLVNVLTGSCGITLSMTGHQRHLMTITVLTGIAMVSTALTVRDRFGMEGIATVASVGIVVHNLAMWITTRRVAGLWTHVGLPRGRDVRLLLGRLGRR